MVGSDSSPEQLSQRVRVLTGISDDGSLLRAILAVTSVLAEQLSPAVRARLSRLVPASHAPAIARAQYREADPLDMFYERVSLREGIEHGFAMEHAQSVCRALAEALDEDGRRQLVACLSDGVATLFAAPEPGRAPAVARGRAHSLATGRPGSSHPLSEARTERAQRDSVARSENPHADTKLSTTSGMTQQREAEDLASSKRPKR